MMNDILHFSPVGPTTHNYLLARIDAFREVFPFTEHAFGEASLRDGRFVTKLRRGEPVSTARIEKAEGFMRDYLRKHGPLLKRWIEEVA